MEHFEVPDELREASSNIKGCINPVRVVFTPTGIVAPKQNNLVTRKRNRNDRVGNFPEIRIKKKSNSIDKSSDYQARGMENLGNTCYFNAVYQCLSRVDGFREKLLTVNDAASTEFISRYCTIFKNAASTPTIHSFLNYMFANCAQKFQRGRQEDADELLLFLLQMFVNEIAGVLDEFLGIGVTKLWCGDCNATVGNEENFTSISLKFPKRYKKDIKIEKLLDFHCADTTVAWKCPNCNVQGNAISCFILTKLPRCLILTLGRFDQGGAKINTRVEATTGIRFGGSDYRFLAAINHVGSSSSNGHYTCDIIETSKVFSFDDTEVSETNIDEFDFESRREYCYVLFYKLLQFA
jgi:ubiquitin carboxyl-terminal hydrolase 17